MSEDTVKLMGYTAQLGNINNGIFGSQHESKDGLKHEEAGWNDAKFKGGTTRGWCKGMGDRTPPVAKDHVNFMKTKCASRKKGFKRINYYRYMTREANSKHTGLYKKGSSVVRGQPCPEASKTKYSGGVGKVGALDKITLSCDYPKIDDTLLRKISETMESDEKQGARYNTWHTLSDKFCANPKNAYKKIHKNETTCQSLFKNKDLARSYCATGDNMAKDQKNCTQGKLTASVYDELGNKFCKANPMNPWCACYNIINNSSSCVGAGATNPGCVALITKRALLKSGGSATAPFDIKPQCQMPNQCSGSGTFQPVTGTSMTCDITLNTCNQNIEQGVAKNSPLNASCNFTKEEQKKADANGASDPKKMSEAEKKKSETEELMGMLEFANEGDKEDAAAAAREGAAGGDASKKKSGSSTAMLIIFAFFMLCMSAGLVFVAMR